MGALISNFRGVVFAGVIAVFLNSCILAPIIQGFQESGATPSSREQLLAKDVKRFTEAVFWGNTRQALKYVDPALSPDLSAELAKYQGNRRLVEGKLIDIRFSESSFQAEVDLLMRYYEVPVYVVKESNETQEWKYSFTDGWKIVARENSARQTGQAPGSGPVS